MQEWTQKVSEEFYMSTLSVSFYLMMMMIIIIIKSLYKKNTLIKYSAAAVITELSKGVVASFTRPHITRLT